MVFAYYIEKGVENMASREYIRGRRNIHLQNAVRLDELATELSLPRGAVMDLLIEFFGKALVLTLKDAKQDALDQIARYGASGYMQRQSQS